MEVSWTALDPSGSASQISPSPERSDENATRRPSGESWGMSSSLVEEIETTGGDEAGRAGSGGLDAPDIHILRNCERRPDEAAARLGRETTGIRPSSPTKGRRAGVFSPGDNQPPKTSPARKRESPCCRASTWAGSHPARPA